MKTPSAQELCECYVKLNPNEGPVTQDHIRIMGNWLDRYKADPEKTIATCNWSGKVTTALFRALGLIQPKTKRDMLFVLLSA